MLKKFNRMFFGGIKGAGKTENLNNIEFERKLSKAGNSYCVNIPPILVQELNLYNGVIITGKENKLIITALNRKDGKENE